MNILQTGNQFRIFNSALIHKELANGVYAFDSAQTGPYLSQIDDLRFPEKVYSNDKEFINHVTHTWNSTKDSLGILLTGKKGLGKSFTANLLCLELGKNLPVIKITREIYKQEGLIDFLNEIKQDHVIFIDEFEKIFSSRYGEQDDLLQEKVFLSFLDGANSSAVRRLFVITTNEKIHDLFFNRPTRLRYIRQYDSMELDIIREIINDKLIYPEYLDDLITNIDQESLNIDILIKIIDEINLHNVPYSSFKAFFNYQSDSTPYDVFAILPESEIPVQVGIIDSGAIAKIKLKSVSYHGFNDYEVGNKEYQFTWQSNRNAAIEKVDEITYKLPITLYSTVGDEETQATKSYLILRKQITRLVI